MPYTTVKRKTFDVEKPIIATQIKKYRPKVKDPKKVTVKAGLEGLKAKNSFAI